MQLSQVVYVHGILAHDLVYVFGGQGAEEVSYRSNNAGEAVVVGEVGGPEELVGADFIDDVGYQLLLGFEGDPALASEIIAGLLLEGGGMALALELVVQSFKQVGEPGSACFQEYILHSGEPVEGALGDHVDQGKLGLEGDDHSDVVEVITHSVDGAILVLGEIVDLTDHMVAERQARLFDGLIEGSK